ncbi:MAG: DUF3857 domain-containing protein, partial [Myxococcales bacterium]|nr:DUF3857 domain-containing protein [Myxococcales bacterium]
DRALGLAPDEPLLVYLSGVEHYQHARLDPALEAWLRVVELGRGSDSPLAAPLAELALDSIVFLRGHVARYAERVLPIATSVIEAPGRLGLPARAVAARLLTREAYRQARLDEIEALVARVGCVRGWKAAGPFGPHPWLRFDAGVPAEGPGALAERYDLGPRHGEQPSWEPEIDGCSVSLSEAPVGGGGVFVLETTIEVAEGGEHLLSLRSGATTRIRVDGEIVATVERRRAPLPYETYHRIELGAGTHELELVMAPSVSSFQLLLDRVDGVEPGYDPSRGVELGPIEGLGAAYLRVRMLLGRGAGVAAREAARAFQSPAAPAPALQLLSDTLGADPFLHEEREQELERRYMEQAAARDPSAFRPAVALARTEQGNREAFEAFRAVAERFPDLIEVQLAFADMLRSRGHTSEADAALRHARELVPEACGPIRAEYRALRARGRIAQANALVDPLLACNRRSSMRFDLLMRRRRWDEARAEFERLGPLVTESSRRSMARRLAQATADDEALRALQAEAFAEHPNSVDAPLDEADRLLEAGRGREAVAVLSAAMERDPASMHSLRRIRRALTGSDEMDEYRMDGARAIAEFEASGRAYEGFGEVLVFDYMVVRVYEDGSSRSLIHQIYKVQSEESLERLGQLRLGGELLTVRSIKPDGRRLEPENIAGLDSIPMTNLAIGDYVEYEYVFNSQPSEVGGWRNGGWSFQSHRQPFDISRIVLILPEGMPLVVDARGSTVEPVERIEGGLRHLSWEMREMHPLEQEPGAVPRPHVLPGLRLAVNATWATHFDALRDMLQGRDVPDPAARRLVRQILGAAEGMTVDEKVRRLHRWVRENIEPRGGFDGVAPLMVSAEAGSMVRVLRYLLGLAGIPSELALARGFGDEDRSEISNDQTYQSPMLRIGEGEGARLVWIGSRHAPADYIPPMLRGQEAVMLIEGAPLVQIPELEASLDEHRIDIDVHLASDGSARLQVEEAFSGALAVMWREQLEEIPQAEFERFFAERYAPGILPGAVSVSVEVQSQSEVERPLVLRYTLDVARLGRVVSGLRLLPPLFPSLADRIFATLPARTTTLGVSPLNQTVRIRMRGAGEIASHLPPVAIDGSEGSSYARVASEQGGDLILERRVRIRRALIPADAYPDFARFCQMISALEVEEIPIAPAR